MCSRRLSTDRLWLEVKKILNEYFNFIILRKYENTMKGQQHQENALKKTFELRLPKECGKQYHLTAVRAAIATTNTIPPQMAAYEMAWAEFAALSIDDRVKECDQGLKDFRTLLLQTDAVEEANRLHDGTQVRFFYVCLSFADYVRICMNKDLVDLNRIMREQGGWCDRALFNFLSGDSFKDLQVPAAETCFLGAAEIGLSLDGDVKRVCFSSLKAPFVEKSSMVNFLKETFPDAEERLSDEAMRFLHSPNSNPQLLSQIMDMADATLDAATAQKLRAFYGCTQCGRADGKMYACKGCGAVRYCGVACQKTHWPRHKEACREKMSK